MATTPKSAHIQTGPKGGRYYLTDTGEKVYVGNENVVGRDKPGQKDQEREDAHKVAQVAASSWDTIRTINEGSSEATPADQLGANERRSKAFLRRLENAVRVYEKMPGKTSGIEVKLKETLDTARGKVERIDHLYTQAVTELRELGAMQKEAKRTKEAIEALHEIADPATYENEVKEALRKFVSGIDDQKRSLELAAPYSLMREDVRAGADALVKNMKRFVSVAASIKRAGGDPRTPTAEPPSPAQGSGAVEQPQQRVGRENLMMQVERERNALTERYQLQIKAVAAAKRKAATGNPKDIKDAIKMLDGEHAGLVAFINALGADTRSGFVAPETTKRSVPMYQELDRERDALVAKLGRDKGATVSVPVSKPGRVRDPRLPNPGTMIEREWRGMKMAVRETEDGQFEAFADGKSVGTHRSMTKATDALLKPHMQHTPNGFEFFRLKR